MAKGFGLTKSNDMLLVGNQFVRSDSGVHLTQKLRSRLQLVQGESNADSEAGLPYFTEIFVKPVDLGHVASLYKTEILNTEGIKSLLRFTYDLDPTERELSISFSVNSIYGEININKLTINIGV